MGLKEEEECSHSAFMDVDEVEALVGGLEYMTKLAAQCQGYTGDYTEVTFSTKGDVQVGFYITDGKVKALLRVENGTAFLPVSSLPQVADLLRQGLRHLQSASALFGF